MSCTDAAPIIVAGHLTVDAHDRDRYLGSCETVVQTARDTDGCLDFAICADLVVLTRINIYESWRDRSALEALRDQCPDSNTDIDIDAGLTAHIAQRRQTLSRAERAFRCAPRVSVAHCGGATRVELNG